MKNKELKILLSAPRGFCAGVERAIEIVEKSIKKLKVKKDLYDFADLTKQNILTLAENGIITLDDLAELDSEELFNILGKDVFANEDDAGSIIMKAREHWFSEIDSEK